MKRKNLLAILLISIGILSGLIALFLVLRQPKLAAPSTTNSPSPTSTKPTPEMVASHEVAPDLPKYISIPAIQINKVRVFGLGITDTRKPASPDNIFDAGWYKDSAKPGQSGAAFIYGHVSSWEADGAFHDLKKLKAGDSVTIIRGDNTELTYKVNSLETYPANSVPMNRVLSPAIAGQQGLNLMTCAGEVIKNTNDFTERLVVYTTRV